MALSIRTRLEREAAGAGAAIVYPEPGDERIVAAAKEVAARGIAEPILVGSRSDLRGVRIPGVRKEVIEESERVSDFAARYAARRGLRTEIARRLVTKPLLYAAMMVRYGDADGMVAGIAHTTASVLRAVTLVVGNAEGVSVPSSCFIMEVPKLRGQSRVPLVFADCAVNVEPTADELAQIALASAASARRFLGVLPRVAMLSFSTSGSAEHTSVEKVRLATRMAAERIEDGFVEGEFQLDAALVPSVARKKIKGESNVAGQANVLIFPDLNAANIAYKAVKHLGGAKAFGPILQGLARPVNDLSRGASVEEVVTVTAITVLQCQG